MASVLGKLIPKLFSFKQGDVARRWEIIFREKRPLLVAYVWKTDRIETDVSVGDPIREMNRVFSRPE